MEIKERGKQLYIFNKDEQMFEPLEHEGLTKREHFAGLALQGLLANGWVGNTKDCASSAVMFADELLEALENESNS